MDINIYNLLDVIIWHRTRPMGELGRPWAGGQGRGWGAGWSLYIDMSGGTWLRSRSMSIPSAFRVVGKKSHRIFTRILYGLKYVTVSSRLPTELNARHLAFICLCVVIVGVLSLYTSGDLAFVISLRSCWQQYVLQSPQAILKWMHRESKLVLFMTGGPTTH